jgi:hypothetical protein
MGTVTAIRVRQHRVRQKLGRACFAIECDEVGLIAALRNTPFWQSANPDHHDEVCAALQRAVAFWIEQELKNENAV